ncbi:MAG: rod shape-determining protein MreC [Mangrovibacterium sp.]
MKNLWKFFSRFTNFFVFAVLLSLSLWLIHEHTNMQRVRLVGATIELVGRVHEVSNNWRNYFSLSKKNNELSKENARLFGELERYKQLYESTQKLDMQRVKQSIAEALLDSSTIDVNGDFTAPLLSDTMQYEFISARVVNNSFRRANNFITINKGSIDGIKPEMGIVGPDGVVGIITNVSKHYAIGPSLLNSRWSVSAKVKRSKYFGTLAWDGANSSYAQLHEIPFHVILHEGDTLITSGFSDVFPEGVPIAIVDKISHAEGANFLDISARLLSNFHNLDFVTVISNSDSLEVKQLNAQIPHE